MSSQSPRKPCCFASPKEDCNMVHHVSKGHRRHHLLYVHSQSWSPSRYYLRVFKPTRQRRRIFNKTALFHTLHTTQCDLLGKKFILARMWPPRSPYLTSLDFILWLYLKNHVYQSNWRHISGLKTHPLMLPRWDAFYNLIKQSRTCRDGGRALSEYLL